MKYKVTEVVKVDLQAINIFLNLNIYLIEKGYGITDSHENKCRVPFI